ncbi:MAG TPA: TIM barrel protein [Bryobacteraceae bacterium]|nr:TIM barrel protein [Bryobacteraceae bacterium]
MLNRRAFLGASLAAGLVGAAERKNRIGRNRISAISDEVGTSPAEALRFAKEFGMEWLELRNVPGTKTPYFYMSPDMLKPAAAEFRDNGIRISFLNTSLLKFAMPGTEPLNRKGKETPEARAKREAREQVEFDNRTDNLRKCIAAAHAFETDRVRIFTFQRVENPTSLYPKIVEILEPMCKIAQEEGVRLLIENEASTNCGTSAETAAFLKLLPSKVLGTNWDSLNGTGLGEKPFPDGYESLPKDRVWNVQIKGKSILDTPERLDWAAILRALERDGYTGELGLETHYFDGTNMEKSHLSMTEIMKLVS